MSAERNDDIDSSSAPLIEHLAELRNRILISLAAFLVGMCIAFTVWNPIFNFLTHPICDALTARGQDCGLVLIKLQEGFFVAIRTWCNGSGAYITPAVSISCVSDSARRRTRRGVFHALADPTRRAMMRRLPSGPKPCSRVRFMTSSAEREPSSPTRRP